MSVLAMTWRCPVCQLDFDEPFCDQCSANLMALPAVVCAWCKRTVSEGASPASHGICDDCKQTHFPRINTRRPEPILAGHAPTARPEEDSYDVS